MASQHTTKQRQHASSREREQAQSASRSGVVSSYDQDLTEDHGQSRYFAEGNAQIRALTRDHEASAVVIALAAGFSVGLVLGCMMSPSRKDRNWWDRSAAEGLGRRLLDRMESLIPETLKPLSERFGK